ncbi:uncharacterized protein LOC129305294 [Prosopis cineraria]|uniref:uncharacterized protein LOC129305294 n=1 Tax=Prosopis cineraria TaxID=364024 RepID=UPI00240F3CA9|nr:uncharacterized protein LOC129305294 [Prosopis cineraria]
MGCREQKRMSLRRKLHILRTHINSKSAKRSFFTKSTVLQIYRLKVMLETIKREYANLIAARREYQNLLSHVQEHKNVKVEKVAEGTFAAKVTCEKGGDKLVAILEAFEEKGLNVEQARVSCDDGFSMEALVVAEDQALDTRNVVEALLRAIGKQSGEN